MKHCIGTFGHKNGNFHIDSIILSNKIKDVLEIIKFQYNNDIILNIDGETGIGQEIADFSKELQIGYHLYLPCAPEDIGNDWFDWQKEKLKQHYKNSNSITIVSNHNDDRLRDQKLIDDSNFIVCFWDGRHQGRTYEMIKYALQSNKLVLHGFNELRLITNKDLKKWSVAK